MLELTLATPFVAGSNVKGSAVGASWRFALPCLPVGHVLCLGRPGRATLAGLAQTAERVLVLTPDEDAAASLREAAAGASLDRVEVRLSRDSTEGWPEERSIALAVVGGAVARRLEGDASMRAALERSLAEDGLVWIESRGRARHAAPSPLVDRAGYWLAPPTADVQLVAPRDDAIAIRYLRRHTRADSGVRRTALERAHRWLRSSPLIESARPRRAILAARVAAPGTMPDYLRALASRAGIDLDGWRWGIAAPGRYSSKKVLCFLFPPGDQEPRVIVKITRDPAFNDRLENERQALIALAERLAKPDGIPQVVFDGAHAGLVAVGESVLPGVPFRCQTTGQPDCPLADAAFGWLTELGARTAGSTVPAAEAAAVLDELLGRFRDVYTISAGELAVLGSQLEALGTSDTPFPLVFQHGDPGIWNALATPAGGVAFLDWETAEPSGVPLWDLLYFARSYGRIGGRGAGVFGPAALDRVVARAIAEYCRRVALDPTLVEPLFFFCWVHRALKEATRLRPERLASSHYLALLRRCLARREDPALRAVLSPTE